MLGAFISTVVFFSWCKYRDKIVTHQKIANGNNYMVISRTDSRVERGRYFMLMIAFLIIFCTFV